MKYVQASGKESLLSFGLYPEVSLEQARRKPDEDYSQKAAGKDPVQIKRQEKAEHLAGNKNSFGTLAAEWLELARSKVSPRAMYAYERIMRRNLPLKRGDIVILDNLSIHKNSFNARRFKRRGIEVKYLPRYSPDLNPIENMWSKVKKTIRKIEPQNEDEIWHATNETLWSVILSKIAGWFRGCGYLH